MNVIWTTVLIISIILLLIHNPAAVVSSLLKGSNDAVNLALTLTALYGFWLGFLALLDDIGAIEKLSEILRPVINFLFGKDTSEDSKKYISMNISANILGLGNASTPMGIKAIESMNYKGNTIATDKMIMLVVISATSLQMLPSTVIGMRVANNSAAPSSFLFASVVATIISTIIGVALVKLIQKINKSHKKT